MHAVPPLAKSPLISSRGSKNVWPKLAWPSSQNNLQIIFTADGWRVHPFNLPLSAPACCWVPFRLSNHCLSSSLSQLQSNSQAELSKPTKEDFKISKRKQTRSLSEYTPIYQSSLQCDFCIPNHLVTHPITEFRPPWKNFLAP